MPFARSNVRIYANLVMDICKHDYDFDNFLNVMDYFKINICKQMNYSEPIANNLKIFERIENRFGGKQIKTENKIWQQKHFKNLH